MGVADQRARDGGGPGGVARHHLGLLRADPGGVPGDLLEAGGRGDLGVRRALGGQVERAAGGAGELHQRHVGHEVQVLEVGDLEGLDDDLAAGVVLTGLAELLDDLLLQGEPDGVEVGRVLGLGRDADLVVQLLLPLLDQGQDLGERRDLEATVVAGVAGTHLRQALLGAQGLELAQGEVLGEPAGHLHAVDRLGRATRGELGVVGDVGGAADLVLVPGHEHAVLGGDQVGLHVVGAEPDGQLVRGQRVLGAVARGTAVAEDEGHVELLQAGRGSGGGTPPLGRAGVGGSRGDRQRDREGQGERQRRAQGLAQGRARGPRGHGTTPPSPGSRVVNAARRPRGHLPLLGISRRGSRRTSAGPRRAGARCPRWWRRSAGCRWCRRSS